ncbi:MAG TPA: hypothetical protein ENO13_00735 [Candidatus Bathyarchaeota archaeon]|nr:hypothetical protein [Candidatus Bathyarchaeota archaeon]
MTIKNILEQLFRGWLPEEPKMPDIIQQNSSMSISDSLKLTNSLKIVYSLTAGAASSVFLLYLISYFWRESSVSVFDEFLYQLPLLFFISAFPLAIFGIIFLTKGNGLTYFKSWNAGKKLQFSGLTIVAGYGSILVLYFLIFLRVQIARPYILEYISDYPWIQVKFNPVYPYLILFGLSIMAIGVASLLLTYKTSAKLERPVDPQKRKTSKITIALFIVVVVLSVSLACLTGVHCQLQQDYEQVSESFEQAYQPIARVVNEYWSDTADVNPKSVYYKAGVLNFGFDTVYNVTVRVSVLDPNGAVLNSEEIFIEKINAVNYVTIETKIPYEGEMDKMSGVAFRWES